MVVLALLLLGSLSEAQQAQLGSNATVSTGLNARITAFFPAATEVEQGSTLSGFTLSVKNTGNAGPLDAAGFVSILNPSGAEVGNLSVNLSAISQMANASTATGPWSTGASPPGTYTAVALLTFNTTPPTSVPPVSASFNVTSPPPPPPPAGAAAAGGGGGAPPPEAPRPVPVAAPILPPPIGELRFLQNPVLVELLPGDIRSLDLVVRNTLARSLQLRLTSTLPGDWAYLNPRSLSLEAGEQKVVNLVATPPAGAKNGDYMGVLTLREGGATRGETFFILRLKYYPPSYALPAVFRTVEVLREEGKSRVRLEIRNGESPIPRLELVEEIPKVLASRPSEVRFEVPPVVLREDPLVKWTLLDLAPREVRSVGYEAPRVLAEYTPYVYFPVRQVTVVTEEGIPLLKVDILSESLNPGQTGGVAVEMENRGENPLNVGLHMETPPGWRVEPPVANRTLGAGARERVPFRLSVPPDAPQGTRSLTLLVAFDGRQRAIGFEVVVGALGGGGLDPPAFALLLSIMAAGIVFGLYTVRRQARRALEKIVKLEMIKRVR